MKATINLKIYDDNNEVIQEFETSRVRWGFLEDVVDLSDQMETMEKTQQVKAMRKIIQMLFPGLTDDLARKADVSDMKVCFTQIISIAKQIEGAEKNV